MENICKTINIGKDDYLILRCPIDGSYDIYKLPPNFNKELNFLMNQIFFMVLSSDVIWKIIAKNNREEQKSFLIFYRIFIQRVEVGGLLFIGGPPSFPL